jgi:hypothetical protein
MEISDSFFVEKPKQNIQYAFGFVARLKEMFGFQFIMTNKHDSYMYVDVEKKLIITYAGEPMLPVYKISKKQSQYLSIIKALEKLYDYKEIHSIYKIGTSRLKYSI